MVIRAAACEPRVVPDCPWPDELLSLELWLPLRWRGMGEKVLKQNAHHEEAQTPVRLSRYLSESGCSSSYVGKHCNSSKPLQHSALSSRSQWQFKPALDDSMTAAAAQLASFSCLKLVRRAALQQQGGPCVACHRTPTKLLFRSVFWYKYRDVPAKHRCRHHRSLLSRYHMFLSTDCRL